MKKHWLYFKYVVRHKWFVFLAGWQIRPECWYQWPLWILRLALHDWDKFTPVEWRGYKRRFDNGNDFTLMADDPDYHMAYHMHMKRNKHHWEWWVSVRGDGNNRALPMDANSRREMLADMYGQGRTVGKPNIAPWYLGWRENMQLHPETSAWLDMKILGAFLKTEQHRLSDEGQEKIA